MATSEEDREDRPRGRAMLLAASERLYGALLALYPKAFRSRYAAEMRRDFADLSREGLEEGGGVELARVWAATLPDLALTALKERSTMLNRNAYRFAVGVALAAAFILFWMSLAVGLIGSEDNPANLLYVGVLAVGIIGAIIARLQPHGMARALFATALAQASVPVIALIIWKPQVTSLEAFLGMLGVFGVNGFLIALLVGSGLLFRYAARERTPAGAGPAEG
jgi:hypothetical protein